MIKNIIAAAIESVGVGVEVDTAFESVIDAAFEATDHVIDKAARERLSDDAFGVPSERKYPLLVQGDRKATTELVSKAIQFFHYCNPKWKKELATNIIKVIQAEKLDTKISPKSQICANTEVPEEFLSTKKEDASK